ncbi:hypothetical protein [Kingella potus]|uniref:hypothetical protein n=1 Tax=Kingella potus TaxID=265175 RepID=UPI001FD06B11|nr:hypothetical protein [Kingella potus]UOP01562.1 hypothetical protein LVJ84_05095 [Kingella potus]
MCCKAAHYTPSGAGQGGEKAAAARAAGGRVRGRLKRVCLCVNFRAFPTRFQTASEGAAGRLKSPDTTGIP